MTCREGHAPRHPDFVPGNVEHLVHGARSPRVVEALAGIVRQEVVDQAPWITEPIFNDALQRYCRAEARARLLSEHIFRVAEDKGAGKVAQRLWESAVASDNAAGKAAAEMGLTPLSRAALATRIATAQVGQQSLAELERVGQALVDARVTVTEAKRDG